MIRDRLKMTNDATAAERAAGVPLTSNPYRLTGIQARRYHAWARGWREGRAVRLGRTKTEPPSAE